MLLCHFRNCFILMIFSFSKCGTLWNYLDPFCVCNFFGTFGNCMAVTNCALHATRHGGRGSQLNSCEEQHSGWKQDWHEDDKHWMWNWSHETNSSNCVSQLMSWPPWNNRMFYIFLFATVPSLPFLPFVYPFKFFTLLTFFSTFYHF